MLMQFRDALSKSNTLKFVLVGIICVPFALFGIGSYFGGGGEVTVATVNGEGISRLALDNALYQQQQRLRQMFGGQLPEGLMDSGQMREGAVEQLIQRSLMVQRVAEHRYTVSDAELARAIRERPEFLSDGQFDPERYERILAANRTGVKAFEQSLRQEQGLQQLYDAVTRSAFQLQGERDRGRDLRDQQREIAWAEFDLEALAAEIEVDEDALRAAYDANPERHQRPERYRVLYVELDPDEMVAGIELDEADIAAAYEARREQYATAEEREAAHILLELDSDADEQTVAEVQARAAELRERLVAGDDFAALAAEFSQDTGSAAAGGSLGYFARGAMVPSFEEAVFAMAEGELSEPVRSEFGIHLIRLTGIKASQVQPLAAVRESLAAALREERVEELFLEQQELLANAAYENSGSLEPAAEVIGVAVKHSPWFSEETLAGIGEHRAVREAVASAEVFEQGLNSELLSVGENHALVIRLDQSEPAALKPFADVREAVLASVREERARERADELAEAVRSALVDGAELAAALEDSEASRLHAARWIGRHEAELAAELREAVFAAPQPRDGAAVVRRASASAGNPVIFVLSGVRTPSPHDETDSGDDAAAAPVADASAEGLAAFAALQRYMRESAEVEIDERALRAGLGATDGG